MVATVFPDNELELIGPSKLSAIKGFIPADNQFFYLVAVYVRVCGGRVSEEAITAL